MLYTMEPIAFVRSPFREKFATPRQPGLTPSIKATVAILPEFSSPEAVKGLEGFSHIWLLFIFHHNWGRGWKASVRPPRLGGNQHVGVYASRSPFRPNPLGLSAVKLLSVAVDKTGICLEVEGADLIDDTPVVDIKPYLPYGDSIPNATGGFAPDAPEHRLDIAYSAKARQQLEALKFEYPELEENISECLKLDPRPAYRRGKPDKQLYGVAFGPFNIRWQVNDDSVYVLDIEMNR